MTERLYYDNAYLTEFDATVLECRPNGGCFDVLLDRSAFYPTSGGQPYDTGVLGSARVTDVQVTDQLVWHTVDQPLPCGETVHGRIDWERRFDHMQQHAADHMIAGTLHSMLGGVTIGLHISDEFSTIDVAMPDGVTRISADDIRRIEWRVNEQIQRDVPVRCWFPEEEELKQLPLRKPPTVSEHVRIVAIGDSEMVACGGTHPSSAGQLGLVKIVSVAPSRGKMRVSFVAGKRALKNYFQCFEAAHAAAGSISANVENLAASVSAMQSRLAAAEAEVSRCKKEMLFAGIPGMLAQAQALPNGARLVACFVEADLAQLKDLASRIIEQPGMIALLGAMNGEQAVYAFGRSADVNADMGGLLRASAQLCGGKGGGRPDFAQGGGSPAMLEAARAAITNS